MAMDHMIPPWNQLKCSAGDMASSVSQKDSGFKFNEDTMGEIQQLPDTSNQENHTLFLCANQDKSNGIGKKKTPMCLINELARYHKLQPQYRLTEESGPAHQKTFVISLKLGEEVYDAEGLSIKKAQHAAAELALQKTSFKLPENKPKTKSHNSSSPTDKPITPTVELNALAMKLNCPPVYTSLEPLPCPENSQDSYGFSSNTNYSVNESSPTSRGDFRSNKFDHKGYFKGDHQKIPCSSPQRYPSGSNQRFYYNRYHQTPMIHRVTLSVGEVFVTGEGPSPQAARHNAAQQALTELRRDSKPFNPQYEEGAAIADPETDSELKSPVSLAHELALKLNQTVEFTVLSESGPPHMRNFVVQCRLGDQTTQGEGNCKKLAKKKAAEIMIEELKKMYPNGIPRPCEGNQLTPHRVRSKPKPSISRKKPRNLVKEVVVGSDGCVVGSKPQDPISQLVQLQQARKEKEPVFTLVCEKGIPRQSPEFVVEVIVGSVTATGVGAKKKDAKRAAAVKALEALGVITTPTSPILEEKSTNLCESPSVPHNTKTQNRQMIPGLLLIGSNQAVKLEQPPPKEQTLDANVEPSRTSQPSKTSKGLRPELRLKYLAQVLEYEVEFSDFPKSKRGDFVSIVTLNTVPLQVSHGLGATMEEAHDDAASNMLKLIAEGALNGVTGVDKENEGEENH